MPSLQLSNLFRGPLAKMSMLTSVPLSLLLLGLQAMIDVKFSCPCKRHYNQSIAFLICFAPAIVALVIMLFLLRPFQYKCENKWMKKICCFCEKQNNSGASQGEDNRGTSQGEDNRGTSQVEDNRGTSQRVDNRGTSQGEDKKETSQSERNELEENLSCEKTFLACLTPSFVWLCLWLIDGDYLACGLTYWDGHYTCDKELHPNCLNWCKPNELSQGKTKTAYEDTRNWIHISKTVGYSLAIIFSFIAICFVIPDYRKSGKSTRKKQIQRARFTDGKVQGSENQQRNDNPQRGNIENATEDDKHITAPLVHSS